MNNAMNRRTFVKKGMMAAGLVAAYSARASSGASPNSRINIGLIGARNMGGKSHLPTLVGSKECRLVAICDVDSNVLSTALADARERFSQQGEADAGRELKGYRDFRELLQRDDLDAVLIATPDHWHVPMAKAAVHAGKDVYVEKPLSLYVEEGRDLANVLKQHPAIVQVGSQQRSDIRFLIADEIVKNGGLGALTHIDVGIPTRPGAADVWEAQPVPPELDYEMWLGPAPWSDYHPRRVHYDFRFVPDFSGGDITNWGAHHLDIAQWALGMDESGPVSVRGTGRRNPAGALHTCYHDIDVDFAYANGATMKLHSGEGGVKFTGEKGWLYVSRGKLEASNPDLLRNRSRDIESAIRSEGGHLDNWLACVRSRQAAQLRAPVEVGHRSATVCHLANIAIELDRPLNWDPLREIFRDDGHANAFLNRPVRSPWKF